MSTARSAPTALSPMRGRARCAPKAFIKMILGKPNASSVRLAHTAKARSLKVVPLRRSPSVRMMTSCALISLHGPHSSKAKEQVLLACACTSWLHSSTSCSSRPATAGTPPTDGRLSVVGTRLPRASRLAARKRSRISAAPRAQPSVRVQHHVPRRHPPFRRHSHHHRPRSLPGGLTSRRLLLSFGWL